MELFEAIKTRRSIRRFSNEQVTADKLKEVVELAAMAPSWKNTQTTRYIAILDRKVIDEIATEAVLGFEYNTNTITHSPALVVVTTINGRSGYERDGSFTTSKETHWQSFDAGIATQTFCLAAHGLGLGSCIMGIFDEAKVKEIAKVPEGQSVSALIVVGYPEAEVDTPPRKDVDTLLSVIQ
ncbi:MAG: nitroreductase family protein [Lachnospiraceae bacterium]|jgi:nitroreductase|nr:nitroreductase family protein [Lachnospiraceae bacterium]